MAELERMPDPKDKVGDFQKKYNAVSKSAARMIGTNIALFICILLPLMLIGFIWTDFGMPTISIKFLSEGIVTVALFVIGEIMMSRLGADGGKLDTDYINARKDFCDIVQKVHDVGTAFLNPFCDWMIDNEMEHAVTTRLRRLRMSQEDWEVIKDLTPKELEQKYGKNKAKKLLEISSLEPIELNDAILLFDGDTDLSRGGVPISGEGYIHKKTHSAEMIITAIFTGLLTVSVAITLTSDISWARVVYTAFKLVVLLYRMAIGYQMGAKAYNTVDVVQLQAKSNYLRQYVRFVQDKTYLKLTKKYGVIVEASNDESEKNEQTLTIEDNVALEA